MRVQSGDVDLRFGVFEYLLTACLPRTRPHYGSVLYDKERYFADRLKTAIHGDLSVGTSLGHDNVCLFF